MVFDATFWPLLPTAVWQPLAITATALIITVLVIGKQQHRKQKTMLYIAGLSAVYLGSIFIDWRSSTLFIAQLYVTILLAGLLLAIGLHLIIDQLHDTEQKHTALTDANQHVARFYQAGHPPYSYAVFGAIVGLIEPTHYSMHVYTSTLLLRSNFSSAYVIDLLMHVLLSLVISLIVITAGYLLVNFFAKHPRRASQPLYTLYAGASLVVIASVLVAIASFVVRL